LRQQLPFQVSFWAEQLKKRIWFVQKEVSQDRWSMLSGRLSEPKNFGSVNVVSFVYKSSFIVKWLLVNVPLKQIILTAKSASSAFYLSFCIKN